MSEIDQMVVRVASEIGRLREELDEVTLRNTRAADIRLAVIEECVRAIRGTDTERILDIDSAIDAIRALADTKEGT